MSTFMRAAGKVVGTALRAFAILRACALQTDLLAAQAQILCTPRDKATWTGKSLLIFST
jgi:hypothetical protein